MDNKIIDLGQEGTIKVLPNEKDAIIMKAIDSQIRLMDLIEIHLRMDNSPQIAFRPNMHPMTKEALND